MKDYFSSCQLIYLQPKDTCNERFILSILPVFLVNGQHDNCQNKLQNNQNNKVPNLCLILYFSWYIIFTKNTVKQPVYERSYSFIISTCFETF